MAGSSGGEKVITPYFNFVCLLFFKTYCLVYFDLPKFENEMFVDSESAFLCIVITWGTHYWLKGEITG